MNANENSIARPFSWNAVVVAVLTPALVGAYAWVWNTQNNLTKLHARVDALPKVDDAYLKQQISLLDSRLRNLEIEKMSAVAVSNFMSTHTTQATEHRNDLNTLFQNTERLSTIATTQEKTADRLSIDIDAQRDAINNLRERIARLEATKSSTP